MSAASMLSELHLRVLSAIILVAIALSVTLYGGSGFRILWFIAAFVCFYEWISISLGGFRPIQYVLAAIALAILSSQPIIWTNGLLLGLVMLTATCAFFAPETRRFWAIAGLIYASSLLFCVVALRNSPEFGTKVMFWLFAIVWASDIAAYFTGRALGGPKLMPRISPKKTWSGFVGGTFGGTLVGSLALILQGEFIQWQHILLAAFLSMASALGDLLESAFKRHFGVKDSGHLIPGHGGVLDRLDGFVVAILCATLVGFSRDLDPARGLLQW